MINKILSFSIVVLLFSCNNAPTEKQSKVTSGTIDTLRIIDTVYIEQKVSSNTINKDVFDFIMSSARFNKDLIPYTSQRVHWYVERHNKDCDSVFKDYISIVPKLVRYIDVEDFIPENKYELSPEMIESLKNSGLNIKYSEGQPYVVPNYSYINSLFKDCISQEVSDYLFQIETLSAYGYHDDASITISEVELAKRMIHRYNIIKNNPDFILISDCKDSFYQFKSDLLYGSDNSPKFNYSDKKLNEDSKAAYEYIIQNLGNDELGLKFKKYYDLLEANKFMSNSNTEKVRDDI